MGLLDEIRNESSGNRPCKLARHLSAMEKKDAAEIVSALDDTAIPSTRIAAVLTRHGWSVGVSSVDKHRKRLCCCGLG